ncbi:MAG: cytochrome c biogenesis protein ResB [Proteobacteria bacterium]|nr:cytochrome c biogenesis protein ResB [Pseudomonadota bacterium]
MSRKKKPKGLFDKIWDIFSSVRLSVLVLLLLAATSIIGTVIPQNQLPDFYFHKYGEVLFRVFTTLNMFDMYHSWWFRFLILVLSMNITICSFDRLPHVWKIVRKKPSFDVEKFRRNKDTQTFKIKGSAQEKENLVIALVRKTFGHCVVEQKDGGFILFSEKGRYSRMGVYVVHSSILLLLMGGMLGSLRGFEGSMMIPEGETSSQVILRNTNEARQLDFSIRCDDFDMSHYDNGAPKEYRSDLTVFENDKEIFKKRIIVNDPLRYKGINVFQSSFGTLAGNGATLAFTSKDSGMVYERKIAMGESLELPENLGTFTLNHHSNSYGYMGHDLGECFIGKLTHGEQEPQEVILPIRFNGFDKMRKGAVSVAVVDYEKRYYTGLQVTKDPGVWLVYLGFILMIIGCWVAFFMSHQSLCVECQTMGDTGCRVMVSGSANKNRMGMALKIKRIASLIKDV